MEAFPLPNPPRLPPINGTEIAGRHLLHPTSWEPRSPAARPPRHAQAHARSFRGTRSHAGPQATARPGPPGRPLDEKRQQGHEPLLAGRQRRREARTGRDHRRTLLQGPGFIRVHQRPGRRPGQGPTPNSVPGPAFFFCPWPSRSRQSAGSASPRLFPRHSQHQPRVKNRKHQTPTTLSGLPAAQEPVHSRARLA